GRGPDHGDPRRAQGSRRPFRPAAVGAVRQVPRDQREPLRRSDHRRGPGSAEGPGSLPRGAQTGRHLPREAVAPPRTVRGAPPGPQISTPAPRLEKGTHEELAAARAVPQRMTMAQKKTLRQRQEELQALLATPAGRAELQELESRYEAAGGKLR